MRYNSDGWFGELHFTPSMVVGINTANATMFDQHERQRSQTPVSLRKSGSRLTGPPPLNGA
jgi:hypothetical protein